MRFGSASLPASASGSDTDPSARAAAATRALYQNFKGAHTAWAPEAPPPRPHRTLAGLGSSTVMLRRDPPSAMQSTPVQGRWGARLMGSGCPKAGLVARATAGRRAGPQALWAAAAGRPQRPAHDNADLAHLPPLRQILLTACFLVSYTITAKLACRAHCQSMPGRQEGQRR